MKKNLNFKREDGLNRWIYCFLSNAIFVYCVIIALSLMLFSFTIIECQVDGASMQPTLNAISVKKSDTAYINKFDKDYKYGDIVVIEGNGKTIIKRVIGLEGDVIDVVKVNGVYYMERNGEVLQEDYILIEDSPLVPTYSQNGMDYMYHNHWLTLLEEKPELFIKDGENAGKLLVGENQIFVLGDNRRVSLDSSINGPYELSKVQGIVENIKYFGTSDFEFYWDYVVSGKFWITLFNIF